MYMIDLLKGQGVPIRSRPEGIAIAVVTAAAPVIVAIIMFSVYLSSKIATSVQMREINNYETKIKSEKLLDDVFGGKNLLTSIFHCVKKFTSFPIENPLKLNLHYPLNGIEVLFVIIFLFRGDYEIKV